MRGVLAEAHVRDHEQVGVRLLDRPCGELDDALVVVGARADVVLLGRDAKDDHCRNAELLRLARLVDGVRDRQPLDARHRLDRRAAVGPELDEQRVHQVRRAEIRLSDQVAQEAGLAQPPHAGGGKGHLAPQVTSAGRPAPRLTNARHPAS